MSLKLLISEDIEIFSMFTSKKLHKKETIIMLAKVPEIKRGNSEEKDLIKYGIKNINVKVLSATNMFMCILPSKADTSLEPNIFFI